MNEMIALPRLRPEMESAFLAAWLKAPGEAFRKGDALYEIETDKVVEQIAAETDGVMGRQLADEGDEVPVGAPLAEIERN